MEFKGLPIKGVNNEEIDIIVQDECPVISLQTLLCGFYGYDKKRNSVSKIYYIPLKCVREAKKLPKTLKYMITKLENKRFYKN